MTTAGPSRGGGGQRKRNSPHTLFVKGWYVHYHTTVIQQLMLHPRLALQLKPSTTCSIPSASLMAQVTIQTAANGFARVGSAPIADHL